MPTQARFEGLTGRQFKTTSRIGKKKKKKESRNQKTLWKLYHLSACLWLKSAPKQQSHTKQGCQKQPQIPWQEPGLSCPLPAKGIPAPRCRTDGLCHLQCPGSSRKAAWKTTHSFTLAEGSWTSAALLHDPVGHGMGVLLLFPDGRKKTLTFIQPVWRKWEFLYLRITESFGLERTLSISHHLAEPSTAHPCGLHSLPHLHLSGTPREQLWAQLSTRGRTPSQAGSVSQTQEMLHGHEVCQGRLRVSKPRAGKAETQEVLTIPVLHWEGLRQELGLQQAAPSSLCHCSEHSPAPSLLSHPHQPQQPLTTRIWARRLWSDGRWHQR